MKKIFFILFLILTLTILSSCEKEEEQELFEIRVLSTELTRVNSVLKLQIICSTNFDDPQFTVDEPNKLINQKKIENLYLINVERKLKAGKFSVKIFDKPHHVYCEVEKCWYATGLLEDSDE